MKYSFNIFVFFFEFCEIGNQQETIIINNETIMTISGGHNLFINI